MACGITLAARSKSQPAARVLLPAALRSQTAVHIAHSHSLAEPSSVSCRHMRSARPMQALHLEMLHSAQLVMGMSDSDTSHASHTLLTGYVHCAEGSGTLVWITAPRG
jgi:hypothetical protein